MYTVKYRKRRHILLWPSATPTDNLFELFFLPLQKSKLCFIFDMNTIACNGTFVYQRIDNTASGQRLMILSASKIDVESKAFLFLKEQQQDDFLSHYKAMKSKTAESDLEKRDK